MLNPHQLALIDKHLRSDNWLLDKALIAELTDHYSEAISAKMAYEGKPFDEALRAVHTDFGGRKGLLLMEENYAKNQFNDARRLFREALWSYFRWPQMLFTLAIAALVAYLSVSNVAAFFVEYAPTFAMAATGGHVALLVLWQGYTWVKGQPTVLNKHNVGSMIFGFNLIVWLGIWPRIFIGDHPTALTQSVLAVVLVLAIMLYEATLIVYLKTITLRATRQRTQAARK